jgi:hypothetical protein
MERMLRPIFTTHFAPLLLLFVPLALWANAPRGAPPKRSPDEVLLVYNKMSRVSKAVADNRKVKNILAIECVDSAIRPTAVTPPDSSPPIGDFS